MLLFSSFGIVPNCQILLYRAAIHQITNLAVIQITSLCLHVFCGYRTRKRCTVAECFDGLNPKTTNQNKMKWKESYDKQISMDVDLVDLQAATNVSGVNNISNMVQRMSRDTTIGKGSGWKRSSER